ncbi:MAG TPA: GDP-mannose 4,6-dehydratase, partial [Gammaproteobacteria bacterium]|nr:GDP-mannose 4,6-dehydratase [Gammaproteobacteria bacterium]
MSERVLITGGAGFIGSHLADELLAAGYRVRVLDNLDPQV